MLKILRLLFPSLGGIPSTSAYEKKLFELERLYAQFMEIKESDEFKRYEYLQQYVSSPEQQKDIEKIKGLSWENSHENRIEKQYESIKKLAEVKHYIKTGEGAEQENVQKFIQLRTEVESPEFAKQKQFLKNKNRYKDSEAYLSTAEFKRLKKSAMVKNCYKFEKKYAKQFEEQEQWVSKLYDDFSRSTLDTSRWLTKPYWGEVVLNGSYSQHEELQLTTDGNNVNVTNGTLTITTRKENAKGLAWSNQMGFIPKAFDYTSGIISTASSFRQLYGKFEAKVRVKKATNIYHAFWMAADTKLPHLNIFKYTGNKLSFAVYNEASGALQIKEEESKYKLNEGYYIYTLIWDEQKITWLINGKKVCECANFINEPMYIAFSSGILGEVSDQRLPAELEVDWVRCFRKS